MKALVFSSHLYHSSIRPQLEKLAEDGWVCVEFIPGRTASWCEQRLRDLAEERGVEVNCRDPFERRELVLPHGLPMREWWPFDLKKTIFVSGPTELITELQNLRQQTPHLAAV